MIAIATLALMVVSLLILVVALGAISHLERKNPPQMPPDWVENDRQ